MREVIETQCPFEDAWREVANHVRHACRHQAWKRCDADELFARVAWRAWREYLSFRGQSTFLIWVIRIVRRESIWMVVQRARRARVAVSGLTHEPQALEVLFADESETAAAVEVCGTVAEKALRVRAIGATEAAVYRARNFAPRPGGRISLNHLVSLPRRPPSFTALYPEPFRLTTP